MSEMMNETTEQSPAPILNYQTPGDGWRPPRRLIPIPEAVLHIALGVALPAVCFCLSARSYPPLDRPWQSGELRVYAGLIPRAVCAWPFYPLLLYSMVSIAIAVIAPRIATKRFSIRLGVYTGIILALQFGVIQWIYLGSNSLLACIGLAGALVLMGMYELARLLIQRSPRVFAALAAAAVVSLLIWALPTLAVRGWGVFGIVSLYVLAVAPILTLASYLAVARVLVANASRKGRRLESLWWLWPGAYSAAWWGSIVSVLNEYAKLPKTAPGGCYIVTAAAGGHPRIVGASRMRRADGTVIVNSRQLRRLKCAELILAQTFPRYHACLRTLYDRVGPPVAGLIAPHRWACDLAYWSLKPVEWAVVLMVRLKRRRSDELVQRVLELSPSGFRHLGRWR